MSLRKRVGMPSPSMIVAIVALVVALGGTGYAAITLPRDSVGTPQLQDRSVGPLKLKTGAVTTDKIADHAVTGQKIAYGSIAVANLSAGALPKPAVPEADKPLELLDQWTADDHGHRPPTYYKDPFGIVHLAGEIHSGFFDEPAFVLPAGYRPAYDVAQPVLGGIEEIGSALEAPKHSLEINELAIATDGTATVHASDGAAPVAVLDGVTFRAVTRPTVTLAQCEAGGGISSEGPGTPGSLKLCAKGTQDGIRIVG